jgi:hypothetical protein
MNEYVVTALGSTAAPINGRYRPEGEVITARADNASYYLENGWIKPKPAPRAKRNAVHDTGRTEPTP